MDERSQLIEYILQLNSQIIDRRLKAISNKQLESENIWHNMPLTMPQFKTLLIVARSSGITVGQLAKGIGVGMPTASGIIDRLFEQGMVTRSEDPEDRRITRVEATRRGHELVEKLNNNGRNTWRLLLERLDYDELQTVAKAIELLSKAAQSVEKNHISPVSACED
jgi:DNA-binding MarR family transcriptional regulator